MTEVTPLKGFYRAEDYHQDYALHNPDNPYILVCDRPKVEALKQQFPELFRDSTGTDRAVAIEHQASHCGRRTALRRPFCSAHDVQVPAAKPTATS